MKSGNLNLLEPSWPLQACNGTALPLPSNSNFVVFLIASERILEYCLEIGHSRFHSVPLKLTECGQLHHISRLFSTREVETASVIQLIKTHCAQSKRICVDDVCTTDNVVGVVITVGSVRPRNRDSIPGRRLQIFL